MIGLGNQDAPIQLYIENIPPLERYTTLDKVILLENGEVAEIARLTGNHWRKIFNVLAKLVFELESSTHGTWQLLRDNALLQAHSNYCLRFDTPDLEQIDTDKLHIVLGKTYATKLGIADRCYWLTPQMAINEAKRLIVCPYFDYRQLSNIKITQLVQLIKSLN